MCVEGANTFGAREEIESIEINKNAEAQEIINIVNDVIESHPYGVCVDAHDVSFLEECRKIKFNNDACTVVEKNGNIISVAKKGTSAIAGFIKYALHAAISCGGDRLDCYNINGFLPGKYCMGGFIPVCRVMFNPKYVSKNWDYEKFGRPEILFMAYCGDPPNVMKRNYLIGYKSFEEYDYNMLPLFGPDEYDEAGKYRDAAMQIGALPDAHSLSFNNNENFLQDDSLGNTVLLS